MVIITDGGGSTDRDGSTPHDTGAEPDTSGGEEDTGGTGSTIEHWTGSLCCVEGATECFDTDSEYDCTTGHTNRTFTGQKCYLIE